MTGVQTCALPISGYLVVPLVALSTLFLAAYVPIMHIIVLVKKTRISGAIWIVCAFINGGLNIVLVPRLGMLGAAITTLVAYTLALGLTTYYSFKEFQFVINWRFIGKSLVASGIMTFAIWLIYPQSNLDTIIAIVVGIIVYGAAILSLKSFKKNEIIFFRDLMRRNLHAANPNDGKNK